MKVRLLAVVALAAAASFACEGITHLSSFKIENPDAQDAATAPYQGLCNRCVGSAADLRHPPCPTPSDAVDTDEVYVYAWRRLRLGVNPDPNLTMSPASYDPNVGYDLDCSDRQPLGLPTRCQMQVPDGGGIAWQVFPRGIDNALTQRVLGPLNVGSARANPTTFKPLDQIFTEQLEAGHGSVLTVVYHWNGTPDDPRVSVRIVSGLGVVGGAAPRWDGTDKWIAATASADPDQPSSQVPQVNSRTDDAYVAGGVLVVDYSFLKPLYNNIVNNGATLQVPLYDFHMVANITPERLDYAQAFGRWRLDDFLGKLDALADFLSGCDNATRYALKRKLPELALGAADLPLDDSEPATSPCAAISATWAADAVRASIGDYKSFSSGTSGCPN